MDIALTISNREISPAVVNLFQFENGTTTLNFTLDSYMYGEVDLRNYKAYGITSINGQIDMTELTATYDSAKDKLVLSWDVKEFTLRQEGAILYQICFKENADDGEGTGVFYSYKGVMINRESIDADNHLTANYPTLLKQWLDRINELAGTLEAGIVYIPYGETIPASKRLSGRLYFQYTNTANTQGRFEDHEGNVLEMGDYLPLTGGVLTGILGFSSDGVNLRKNKDSASFVISGGVDQTSSTLKLNGKTSSNKGFALSANDGSTKADLQGLPDGSLTWNGKNVVRSVNNATANAAGNVTVDVGVTSVNGKTGALSAADTGCLPLSGGKMTGGVDLDGKVLNAGTIELIPPSSYNNGGVIDFHYAGSTENFTSRIIEDAEGKITITAPNGFKVNGKDVVRSVNGTAPDSAGNVAITSVASATSATKATQDGNGKVIANTYLPLAGGTVTGVIKTSNTIFAQKTTDNSYVEFRGATSYLNGAYLRLDGKDSSQPGRFILATGDGSKNIVLKGSTDGTLEWNGQSVSAMGMPSGAYVNLELGSDGTTYTAPADGWYTWRQMSMSSGTTISIINNFNGLEDRKDCMVANGRQAVCIPAKKGQTVRILYNSGNAELFRFVYAEGVKHLKA